MTTLAQEVERVKQEGWELQDRTDHRAVMVSRSKGDAKIHAVVLVVSLLAAAVTGIHILAAGNVAYFWYKYVIDADKRILRAEEL